MKSENIVWKDIPGYVGLYQVSNNGQVRGLQRKVGVKSLSTLRAIPPRTIKPRINNYGYVEIRLSKNGKTVTKLLHVLIAEAFIPRPTGKVEVNHIDGVKQNNSCDNLEFVTHSENMLHAYRTGLISSKKKKVVDTCNGEVFDSFVEAAAKNNIAKGTLRGYLTGQVKNKTCLEYL